MFRTLPLSVMRSFLYSALALALAFCLTAFVLAPACSGPPEADGPPAEVATTTSDLSAPLTETAGRRTP